MTANHLVYTIGILVLVLFLAVLVQVVFDHHKGV